MRDRSKIENTLTLLEYSRMNREAWNEATIIHRRNREIDIGAEVQKAGFNMLEPFEVRELNEIGLEGKSVVHVCCNNGVELISILRMGAKYGLGIDISDQAIKEATELACLSKVNAEFVRTDVYEIGDQFYGKFDLAYFSAGGMYWLPNLGKTFRTVANMLSDDGTLFICDMHPFINMLATDMDEEFDPKHPLRIKFPYFKSKPQVGKQGMDYIGKTRYKAKPNYKFNHTLSSIFNAILESGIRITEFNEHKHDLSRSLSHLTEGEGLPLSYTLRGRKMSEVQAHDFKGKLQEL